LWFAAEKNQGMEALKERRMAELNEPVSRMKPKPHLFDWFEGSATRKFKGIATRQLIVRTASQCFDSVGYLHFVT
jgi:hypothetical protein